VTFYFPTVDILLLVGGKRPVVLFYVSLSELNNA